MIRPRFARQTLGFLIFPSLAFLLATTASAQTPTNNDNAANQGTIEEIVVTGTKRVGVTAADLAVPVDVISAEDLQAQNSSDVLDVLASVTPSLNVSREPISDAATFVRPLNLRGLPADSALILVNGKRRHKSAVVSEFVAGLNRGAHAVDISSIPTIALEQVEVLRDGASAQYGSDAIAGVINLRMTEDVNIRRLQAQLGSTYEGDGSNFSISGVWGFPIRDDGFLTAAFEYKTADPTNRAEDSPDVTRLRANDFPVASEPEVWGAPKIVSDLKFVYNFGVEAGPGIFYSYGNVSDRKVDGSFFFRNPIGRSNVYVNEGVDENGDGQLLVVDLTADRSANCTPVSITDYQIDSAVLSALRANADCFAFNEIPELEGGFTPRFVGKVTDTAVAAGYRGENASGSFHYDISANFGQNKIEYNLLNTLNASYGPAPGTGADPNPQRDFFLGTQAQQEILFNADFVNTVEVGAASPLNIAYGFQFLQEQYKITPGEEASWNNGNPNLTDQGFSLAANGFAGFNPAAIGTFKREAVSAYLDFEIEATERWLTSFAVRFEDYSDFGDILNIKFANRFRVNDLLSLRGAFSTGFRAPSSGQSGLQRLSTTIINGQLVEELLVLPNSAIARRFGGGPLGAEKSRNFSFGAVITTDPVDITLDYFNITVENRLTTVDITLDEADRDFLRETDPSSLVQTVSFFSNAIDTRTQGFDLTATFQYEKGNHFGEIGFLFNWTDTKIRSVLQPEGVDNTLLTDEQRRIVENGLPPVRFNLSWRHGISSWSWLVRLSYFDKITESLFNEDGLTFQTSDIVYVDAEVTWDLPITSANYSVSLGARNIFNAFLDRHPFIAGGNGSVYPLAHPAGFQGGAFYGRLSVNF